MTPTLVYHQVADSEVLLVAQRSEATYPKNIANFKASTFSGSRKCYP